MSSFSSSLPKKPEVTLSLTFPTLSPKPSQTTPKPEVITSIDNKAEERGIVLIQHLLSCASHAASGNLRRADTCLAQIAPLASTRGDPMQRLAAWLASALAARLVKRWPGLHMAQSRAQRPVPELGLSGPCSSPTLPVIGLAYPIISRTLAHAMSREGSIHIVDLGSGDFNLWAPLVRGLVEGGEPRGRGAPRLRLTCVHGNKYVLDELGRGLVKEADALGLPFQYNPINVGLGELTEGMLKIRRGESLAFVSILGLHVLLAEDDRVEAHFGANKEKDNVRDSKQMGQFLAMVKSMSPKVVLLVEQESDHNLNRLVDRFCGSLHYYSAVFDSLESTFGGSPLSEERLVLEGMFGREIENIVAFEGLERVERHERYDKWMIRFSRAGFKPVRIWFGAYEDGKKIFEACGSEGYKILSNKASLVLCWHERPLYAVSAWTC